MISKQILNLRKNNGYTQQQMADMLHITQACYNRYEKGIREPSIEIIKMLCIIFDCTADELLEIDTPLERKKVVINHSFNNSKDINLKI